MDEEGRVDVTLVESKDDEAILERASDGTDELAGNIELELPNALQDLLRRLSGVLRSDEEAVTRIPYLNSEEYGDFFRASEESVTRSEVRLKVLDAVGKCKTLRGFDNFHLKSLELSFKEWKALLVPMQNNLEELEEIEWHCLPSSRREEEIGPLLHGLVEHAQNLGRVRIRGVVIGKSVAAVASGLRVNGYRRLKKLEVTNDGDSLGDENTFAHVAEIISLAPELIELSLEGAYGIHGNTKETLTAALKGSSNLRHITCHGCEKGMADVLVDVYGGTPTRPPLERLMVRNGPWLTGDALAFLTCSNILHIELEWRGPMHNFSIDTWQTIGRGLLQPLTLTTLTIKIHVQVASEVQNMETGLRELWMSSQQSPILHISLIYESFNGETFRFLERAVQDTYLKEIIFLNDDISLSAFESFVQKLASNTSVRSLILGNMKNSGEGWAYLFHHLRENTSMVKLGLFWCKDLTNKDFREFMELLQVNFTLQEVNLWGTEWASDGKDALVREVLNRNKKLAGYFSVLGDAKLAFGGAKAGRIFMCGAPYADNAQGRYDEDQGKASRSESLVSVIKQKLGETITKLKPGRTKGIEVELLCDDPSMIISIWDFAGQEIFRALQNILFPKLNQACVFVFAFNPFQEKGKELKKNISSDFAEELASWLRFIVSNTRITSTILPQVFIIVTHRDKIKKRGINFDLISDGLENAVRSLQDKFRDVVDISPHDSSDPNRVIYYVNATKESDVQLVTDNVLSCMKDVLARKSSKVPLVCSELVSSLLKRPQTVQLEPLWSSGRFFSFCSDSNPQLQNFKLMDPKGKAVLTAVASYMHDVGVICMTPTTVLDSDANSIEDLKKPIVVDLNWLTQNLLGQLVSIGHGFEVGDEDSRSHRANFSSNKPGFINDQQLTHLIDRVVSDKGKHVDHRMVRELLLELDLCYPLESARGVKTYFMPIIFRGGQASSIALSMSQLKWSIEEEGSDHFGYRVQCQDNERTSFTPALFPRYQIHLRKEMQASHEVIDENFIFSLSYVEIRVGGCSILVEIDESRGNHLDIMVKVSKLTTRDWAMNFVQKHIVRGFSEFCASEKGCAGLQLVVGILRTDCVKKLTPRELRKECQSILVEDLKRKFQTGIENQLQDGQLDMESTFGYIHHWPEIITSISKFQVSSGLESAHMLLSCREVNDIVTAVHSNHKELGQNLEDVKRVSTRLDAARKEHQCLLLSPSGQEKSSSEEFFSQEEHKTQFLGPLVARPSFKKRNDLTVGDKLVLQGLNEVREGLNDFEENVMENFARVREELRQLKSCLKEMQSRMSQINSAVDRIIRYKVSEEKHRCPRRPYFSPHVPLSQKIKAMVLNANAVRLHLMCEARNRPHFVKDQPGLELQLKKEGQFAEWIRTLSVISLHMIWMLLKIGAQVTAGLGSAVPEISNLGPRIAVGAFAATVTVGLDQLKTEMVKDVNLVKNERSVEDAWCSFRNYIGEHLTPDKCAEKFRLHLVRYKNSDDPYAWLCEPCMLWGRRNSLLE